MSTLLRISSGDARALGRSLRTWRALQRIKQLHAAQLLGVSQATVSRRENGQSPPAPDEAERLRTLMAARLGSDALAILACNMRWVRFQLSDGSFVRLVETVAAPVTQRTHAAGPASRSASAVIESH